MTQQNILQFTKKQWSNRWILDHIKHNIQACPYCFNKPIVFDINEPIIYNVVWKKKLSKRIDKWYCRSCKKYFRLPNKYKLVVLRGFVN